MNSLKDGKRVQKKGNMENLAFIGIQNMNNQCWFRAEDPKHMLTRKRWVKKSDGKMTPIRWRFEGPLDATRFARDEDAVAVCKNLVKCMPDADWRVVRWSEMHAIIRKDVYCPNKKDNKNKRRSK